MAVVTNTYGTKTVVTISLNSLANGAAWQSVVVDNATTQHLDALLRVQATGIAGGVDALEVYAYGALGDTVYTDGASGTDITFTAADILNAKLVGVVALNTTVAVVSGPMSVAAAFGGVLPDKWGLIVKNASGAALAGAGNVVEFEGITATVA